MARYTGPREKIERRLGEKLLLKGERSRSQKSAMTKRPYPPGVHGKKRFAKISEYGMQLKSKQKVRNTYRLMEKQFKNYIKSSIASKKEPYESILYSLEYRLDNIVFRSGIAQSRDQARQLVSHGHINVDGRKVNTPSYQTKVGNEISIRETSKKSPFFTSMVTQWIKSYDAPEWIILDKNKLTARIKGNPTMEDSGIKLDDLQAIIEYYSR